MASSTSWWGSKVRQFRAHLRARVSPEERAALVIWTTAEQGRLFDSMHVADRRHGLDVVATLRADRVTDPDVLVAALVHDAGKGATGVWPRVWRAAAMLPGFGPALERLRDHPERSAALANAAGCSARTVDLIRYQDDPRDPEFGELLRLADEAN